MMDPFERLTAIHRNTRCGSARLCWGVCICCRCARWCRHFRRCCCPGFRLCWRRRRNGAWSLHTRSRVEEHIGLLVGHDVLEAAPLNRGVVHAEPAAARITVKRVVVPHVGGQTLYK